jgi:hypothetical protein
MESAESVPAGRLDPAPSALHGRRRLVDAPVVLQVDGVVTRVQGLAWLMAQRDAETLRRLSDLQVEAMADDWAPDALVRARLACLRPRRAEINALGRAYLDGLAPGVVNAAHRIRRAGIAVELFGEVGVESLFHVADALGVTPDAIHGPRLRFDALGSYVGCELGERASTIVHGVGSTTDRAGRLYVGTRQSELLVDGARDAFVRYTGFVTHEGSSTATSVASFAELAELVLG